MQVCHDTPYYRTPLAPCNLDSFPLILQYGQIPANQRFYVNNFFPLLCVGPVPILEWLMYCSIQETLSQPIFGLS